MSNFSANLRFVLWQNEVPRSAWVEQITQWVGCDALRAEKLLREASPSPQELDHIVQATHVNEDELMYTDLLRQSELDLWQENVLYLLKTLKHGEQKRLTDSLGICSPATISKWKNRTTKPERTYKKGIQHFFGLPDSMDLEHEPLFLSLSPIDTVSQRIWLHQRIDALSDHTLQKLFPALERLFKDS